MKKTILSALILFFLTLAGFTQQAVSADSLPGDKPPKVLIVDATLTIMLVNSENATLHVEGNKFFREYVTVQNSGDTLTIGSVKNQNLITSGVVYVPARHLQKIRVNSGADVRTLFALKIPRLDVVVNGACTLAIANVGEVNVIEAKGYATEKSTRVKYYPNGVL